MVIQLNTFDNYCGQNWC